MGKFDIGNTGEDTGTDPDDFRNSNTMGHPKPTDSEQLRKEIEEIVAIIALTVGARRAISGQIIQLIAQRDQQRLSAALEIVGDDEPWLRDSLDDPRRVARNEFRANLRPALTATLGPDNSKSEE